LASTFGCSPAPGDPEATPSKIASPAIPTGPTKDASGDFCKVKRPSEWATQEKRREYQSSPGFDRRGIAVSSDGSILFAIESEGSNSRLVQLRDKGTTKHVIYSLKQVGEGKRIQFGSTRFDGRWLLFEIAYDAENWNDWALYAWDSNGDSAPFQITRHDKSIVGPFLFVQVRDGKAAWAEGVAGGKKAVHLFNLASRKDSVVHTGQTSPVFLAGDIVGWREAPSSKDPVLLRAVSIRTGKPVQLPPIISKIRGAAHVAGDGKTWTWVSPDYRTLYAWKPGWEESATIAKAAQDEHIDQMELSGDLVTWIGGKAIWAADLRSHSRTTLTSEYGSVVSNGDALLVTYLTGGYSKQASKKQGTTSYVLRTPELNPLPNCASWTPVPQPPNETGAPGTEPDVTA
ncbi:hypothetical protein ACWCQP_48200, partial [Streptomyces chartreusis]